MSPSFSSRLQETRIKKGLTQRELASKVSLTRAAVSLYEQGKREPSFAVLQQLAETLEVSDSYLLGRTDDPGTVLGSDRIGMELKGSANAKPQPNDEIELKDVRFAHYGLPEDITEEEIRQISAFIRFLREEDLKKG